MNYFLFNFRGRYIPVLFQITLPATGNDSNPENFIPGMISPAMSQQILNLPILNMNGNPRSGVKIFLIQNIKKRLFLKVYKVKISL
jgi:hypothetical protein